MLVHNSDEHKSQSSSPTVGRRRSASIVWELPWPLNKLHAYFMWATNSRKKRLGLALATFAFAFNSVNLLMIPWSSGGYHHHHEGADYPYRFSSVMFLQQSVLVLLYLTYFLSAHFYQSFGESPKRVSVTIPIETLELRTLGSATDHRNRLAQAQSNDKDIAAVLGSVLSQVLESRVFLWTGLLLTAMDICLFNILNHAPLTTFALLRNFAIPCTAVIKILFFQSGQSVRGGSGLSWIEWFALTAVTSTMCSFVSQEINQIMTFSNDNGDSGHGRDSCAGRMSRWSGVTRGKWFYLSAVFMAVYVVIESINIVYLESLLKRRQITVRTPRNALRRVTFTEKQFWISMYSLLFTATFWVFDNAVLGQRSTQRVWHLTDGFTARTYALIFWRVLYTVAFFVSVRYLTSLFTMVVFATSTLGTSLLDSISLWLFRQCRLGLTSGQWFDAFTCAMLILIYKMAQLSAANSHSVDSPTFGAGLAHPRFEILDLSDSENGQSSEPDSDDLVDDVSSFRLQSFL